MLVQEFMTPNPVTITPDTSHMEALNLMRNRGFRRLPVVDSQGQLVGIVVEKDLLTTQPSPATTLSIWEIHSLITKLKVKTFMSKPVYTIRPDCPIEDAARLMVRFTIGCLPVMTDGEEPKLAGIITETDIFKALTRMMSGGEEGTRITMRLQRHRGVIGELANAITAVGGRIVSLATENEADGEHKQVMVKVVNSETSALREAILSHANWEILDLRESSGCHQPGTYGGK